MPEHKESPKKEKQKIDWKRTFKNNGYMLKMIADSCPGILVMMFVTAVLSSVHSFLLTSYLYKYALNALQAGEALENILITLGCMLAYSVLHMIFQTISNCYFELNSPRVEAHIQNMLQKKAVETELACFENSDFYDIYVKASGEASERAFAVLKNIANVIWLIVNVAAVGALIIAIDPLFLLLAAMPLLCTLLVGKKRNRVRYEYKVQTQEAERQRDYVRRTFYLNDFSKEMRLTEMWRVMFRRMHDCISEMKAIVQKHGYKLMWFRYLFDFVFDIVVYTGSIILAAFKTLVTKSMLLGDCFVVINSITNIAYAFNDVGDLVLKLDENSLYVDNLRKFMEYETQIPEIETAAEAPSLQTLELRDLNFTYESQTAPVLQNINLTIRAGEKIAVVGHNGAGKTTLIKLLLRLYDPSEGEILLNGENIKNYRLSSYRSLFGTVFQDYGLFAVSIAENVMLRGGITDEDRETVKEALLRSGIYGKIESLPCGTDTIVTREFDSEGAVFSGGEEQKISIARIFAGGHEIVIMDEPTSALDPIAEQEMYRSMFEACESKTVIFISHRLSSATMADRVYLFENGRIVEQGTHSELLSLGAKYADMWHKQADSYTAGYAEEVVV